MSFALMSVMALVASIALGVLRKVNIGVIAMFFAFMLGHFVFGMKGKELVRYWPLDVFFMMMSAQFMFSFASTNGTTKLVAEKLAYAIRNYAKLLPWAFMFATIGLTVCGADPAVVIFMLPVALIAGEKSQINPIIMCIMILAGAIMGGAGPISIIGLVTSGLASKVGVDNYLPIWAATFTSMFLQAAIVYFAFGGYKAKSHEDVALNKPEDFTSKQKITLVLIALVLVLILFLKMPLGGAMFIGAALMLLFNVASEKDVIKNVSWGVLLMVGGTGMLVEVMSHVGGVKMVAKFLTSIMNPSTAAPIIGLVSALMTFVSSFVGVVAPTLIPLVPSLAQEFNGAVEPVQLIQAIQSVGYGVCYSPLSSLGALAMASLPADVDSKKVFTQLMIAAFACMVFAMVLNFVGAFKFFI